MESHAQECSICGKTGHLRKMCEEAGDADAQPAKEKKVRPRYCFNCGSPDHAIAECTMGELWGGSRGDFHNGTTMKIEDLHDKNHDRSPLVYDLVVAPALRADSDVLPVFRRRLENLPMADTFPDHALQF